MDVIRVIVWFAFCMSTGMAVGAFLGQHPAAVPLDIAIVTGVYFIGGPVFED